MAYYQYENELRQRREGDDLPALAAISKLHRGDSSGCEESSGLVKGSEEHFLLLSFVGGSWN